MVISGRLNVRNMHACGTLAGIKNNNEAGNKAQATPDRTHFLMATFSPVSMVVPSKTLP